MSAASVSVACSAMAVSCSFPPLCQKLAFSPLSFASNCCSVW
uniref:Uncharacterized protein n=1 Tax=Arundo donax TaxID=35708 RepID=A0A0A9GH14_ARUDO